MRNINRRIKSFFGFSRTQTNGFVALLLILFVVIFSEPVYHAWVSNRPVDFSSERKMLDSLTALWQIDLQKRTAVDIPAEQYIPVTLFAFNPNTITKDELKTLGFSERLVKGLLNYRTKGGEFRVKADVKKLYGMDSTFYKRLSPFIQLPERIVYEKAVTEVKKKPDLFDLNLADSAQFQQIYGIGPVLAKRIIKYRDRLGGFVRNDQLSEVYGLDSLIIAQLLKASFLTDNNSLKKLNINTADEKMLSSHPYFSKNIARAIVTYRFQHGNYPSVDDLRRINLIDEKIMNKIYPYLTVD
jgi:DNA uptake protein ComE-like DNA-binding protein